MTFITVIFTSPGEIQCDCWNDFASCSDSSTGIHEKSLAVAEALGFRLNNSGAEMVSIRG